MRILLLCCWGCLFLTACSLPKEVTEPDTPGMAGKAGEAGEDLARPGRMLNIRIERWEKLRFSGLLGIRETAEGLDYVLLDATGIKLLQAKVMGDGSYTVLQESGPLHKSGLAPFLSEALARIYLQEPVRLPCTGSWFYRLCREAEEDGSSVKYGQAGPFTVWRITGKDPAGDAGAMYHQPWLGVKVKLERLESGK